MSQAKQKKNPSRKKAPLHHRLKSWFHSSAFFCTLVYFVAFLLLSLFFVSACTPKKYDFSVGSISHETINAPKDVVDEVTTEDRKNAAAAAVEPIYHFQEGVKEEVLASLDSAFQELRTVQQYGLTLRNTESEVPDSFTDEEIAYALDLLHQISYTRYQIATLLRIDTPLFDEMVSTVTTATENSLNTTIREGQVSQSIQTILQIVGYRLDVSLTQNIIPTLLRTCIKPNMIIDQESTDAARQKARDTVEPTLFLQGQNIVREGDRITRSQLSMLSSLGLLNDNSYDYSIYGGSLLLVVLAFVSFLLLLQMLAPDVLSDLKRTVVTVIVLVLSVLLGELSRSLPSLYITPVAFAAILLAMLIHERAGLCVTVPLAILFSGIAAVGADYSIYDVVLLLLMTLTGNIAALWFLRGHPQRIRSLLAGVISALFCEICLLSIKYISSSDTINLLQISVWSIAGNLTSGILAFAMQPVFETLFRLPTPTKLLDLTNPNQEIMRRMMIEAPGTYHHSIIVANLAESAAARIGANSYLARAGAYYHDIGKLKRPTYFKENQMGDNPHERTDPYISAAILTSHVKDGVLLAQKMHLPLEIQSIIQQHHGDTAVMFFYHKALQMSNGSPVDIREFRYDGPRPKTREAAIVMLADTIEAAVRSMKDPTPRAIDQFIERLVRGKLEDGQLSDSPLTLRDIDQICEAFSTILRGVFHERIEYPTVLHTVSSGTPDTVHAQEPSEQKPAQGEEENTNAH